MKILSVSHYYPPHVGGLEVVAKKQVESLRDEGHTVRVLTCAVKDAALGKSYEEGVTVHRERASNILDTRFGIPFPIPGVGMMVRIFTEVRRADAVHIHDVFYMPSWFACFFAVLFRKPIVLTQHVAMVEHRSRAVMLVQRIVYRIIGDAIFKASRAIIVYNCNVANFLNARGVSMDKVIELRNGIDLSTFRADEEIDKDAVRALYGIPLNIPVALFVGRFVPKKGVDVLYHARAEQYHIVFAGTGHIPPEWSREKNVSFIGPLTHSELAKLYCAVDLFVFPAVGEIFTLVMQEAMASGLPIITTDDPGYHAYAVDRNLIKFTSPDSVSLTKAISEVISDAPLAKNMKTYSLKLAKEWFDWHQNIHPVLELYSKLSMK